MLKRADYPHPVSELLDHGPIKASAADVDNWFDYVGHYDIGEIDVPVLIDLMAENVRVNPKYPNERYAPTHACRALAQLGDMVAEDYFVYLIEHSKKKKLVKNATAALTVLGLANLELQKKFYANPATTDESRINIMKDICELAQRFPQTREGGVAFLVTTLSNYEHHTREMNMFLVHYLVKMKATEASAVMEKAIKLGRYDDQLDGTWPAIQVTLGLAKESDFEPEELRFTEEMLSQFLAEGEQAE